MPEFKDEIEIDSEEYKRMVSDYKNYITTFANGFVSDIFSEGLINEVSAEKLKKYFSNPDTFQPEIENLAEYYYITTAEIHILYEMIEALPTLNYKLESFEKNKSSDKCITLINKTLNKIKHKRLTRDLLKQLSAAGTLVGIWLGDKKNLYPFVFDDIKYVFPSYRRNGEWVCVLDIAWFDRFTDKGKSVQFENLNPYVTETDYKNYLSDNTNYKYKELPIDRTFILQTGKLKRNQGLGTSWVTASLFDVLHKKKLKDVESVIANKIINAVAVLTIGHIDNKNNEMSNLKLPSPLKRKVHNGVKAALEKNSENGITVVSIPDYANIEFPDVKVDGLDSDKFSTINSDIQSGIGLSGTILNGSGGNYNSAKMKLETFYKRLAVMLEDIETEVYQKMFNIILPSSQQDNFTMSYDKEAPLSLKEKIDILSKLNDKGWSVKAVVDNISGISWESYLEQTLYETETLKLQEKIKPYMSTHTTSNNQNGRPSEENPDNENTIKSKTTGSNNLED